MRDVVEIKGVGPVLAKACAEKGYHSVKEIAEAKPCALACVQGIGPARAEHLIGAARSLLGNSASSGIALPTDSQPESKTQDNLTAAADGKAKKSKSKKNKKSKDKKSKKDNKKSKINKNKKKTKKNKKKKSKSKK